MKRLTLIAMALALASVGVTLFTALFFTALVNARALCSLVRSVTRQCTAEKAGRRQKLSSSKRHDTPHSRKSKTKTQKEIRRFICLCDAEVRDEQSRRVAAIRIISTSLTNGRSCSRAQITRSRDWSKLERRGGERTFFSIPLFSPMHRLAPSLLKLSCPLLFSIRAREQYAACVWSGSSHR